MRPLAFLLALFAVTGICAPCAGAAVRVKDIARVDGVRRNQLIGYGLVVGLDGTGDQTGNMTGQAAANLLEKLGISVPPQTLKLKNVAAVMATADLTPFARSGQRLDVMVSSMGDAKSLQGGTLLLTALRAPNGQTFAAAQGPVSIGGFSAASKGASVQKNHPTVGRIPGGAILERDAPLPTLPDDYLDLLLEKPDYTTAARMAVALNGSLGSGTAEAVDAGRVRVAVPTAGRGNPVDFLASVEAVTLDPDLSARVVLDERTGTVVLGQEVKIRPVAISHGNLTVQVTPKTEVSQPLPLSKGKTVTTESAEVSATEQPARVVLLEQGESLASLVHALNALGVTARDLVAIFQTLKAAGALQAELEIL